MNKLISQAVLTLMMSLGLINSANASNYPADYSVGRTCLTQGPVTVCRSLQMAYTSAVLDVYYNGVMKNSPGLKAWIQVNYEDGSRNLTVPFYNNPLKARVTAGCVVAALQGCSVMGNDDYRYLLEYAQQQNGTLNALDLDIAVTDKNGNWDNNGREFGTYHFEFPQQ
ncbi:MAG: hypothetical protein ACXVCY_16920 [Pseudobdellovibrionaceae bacterium]